MHGPEAPLSKNRWTIPERWIERASRSWTQRAADADQPPPGADASSGDASAADAWSSASAREAAGRWREAAGDWASSVRSATETLAERAAAMVAPSLRIGVTGLSRSGKTVFLTALVHNLVHGGRLPVFRPYADGRLRTAALEPQPDDAVPRFAYEDHVHALVEERVWPESTRRISQLRVTIDYESARPMKHRLGPSRLHLDIVDYPGEWLLDLPLLNKDYATWARESLAEARKPRRLKQSAHWLKVQGATDPNAPAREQTARELAAAFTEYLEAVRGDPDTLASLPPGRFLMPGDLEGSPALTFAPLDRTGNGAADGSLWAMMERRYESYKAHVVKPFLRDHFARLDRQIVLVDALSALNGGPEAVAELQHALAEVLGCFRTGRLSRLAALFDRRIEKVLFAATKADHIHHSDHDRLEAVLRSLVDRAMGTAATSGAAIDVAAIAAVRATREANVRRDGEMLPAIVGTPLPGERLNGTVFDGSKEIALFPGDLPADPAEIFAHPPEHQYGVSYLRFRPPAIERSNTGTLLSLPHIRLDRALNFLIGDRLQ